MPRNGQEAARAEVAAILQSGVVASGSRQARLLEYLLEQHVSKPGEAVKEYAIGLDVLGKTTEFDPHSDASVRVEAHRLRRKLERYYETAGRHSRTRAVLPAGQYLLEFRRDAAHRRLVSRWTWMACGAGAAAVVIVALLVLPGFGTSKAAPAVAGLVTDPDSGAIRILAGSEGRGWTDLSGRFWAADRFFQGGSARPASHQILQRTGRPAVFAHAREGNFSYRIPVQPGAEYVLCLYLAEPDGLPGSVDPARQFRILQVTLNESMLINDLNLRAESGFAADIRCWSGVRGRDGHLDLSFRGLRGPAVVSGIELIPMEGGKPKPIRISAQASPYVDAEGRLWHADDYYSGGDQSTYKAMVRGGTDPGIFSGERYGDFEYFIPVPPGSYEVRLHFAETWFGAGQRGGGGPGSRIFDVFLDHRPVIEQLDLVREVGPEVLLTRTLRNVRPDSHGKIHLSFASRENFATLRALEVIPE